MVPSESNGTDIKARIFQWLAGTRYAAESLEPLTGGTANFVYLAQLLEPLEDGTTEVVIKHGESYVATSPEIALSTDRCRVEEECLRTFGSLRADRDDGDAFKFIVRVPKVHLYDSETKSQVQEFLRNGVNLKSYAIDNFTSPTHQSLQPQCYQLGKCLARYAKAFHLQAEEEVSNQSTNSGGPQSDLHAALTTQKGMQDLKHMINYDWLLQRIDMFPEILEGARDVFEKVKQMAVDELKGDLLPIHGDFWTGNILLPNVPITEGEEMPILVIDWEMTCFGVRLIDHGQMIAEMYLLWLYRRIDAGLWMIYGYAEGLGHLDEWSACRLAIQVGVHLLSFGTVTPGWGTQDQVQDVAALGRDIIVHAWNRDFKWLKESDLACLFS